MIPDCISMSQYTFVRTETRHPGCTFDACSPCNRSGVNAVFDGFVSSCCHLHVPGTYATQSTDLSFFTPRVRGEADVHGPEFLCTYPCSAWRVPVLPH